MVERSDSYSLNFVSYKKDKALEFQMASFWQRFSWEWEKEKATHPHDKTCNEKLLFKNPFNEWQRASAPGPRRSWLPFAHHTFQEICVIDWFPVISPLKKNRAEWAGMASSRPLPPHPLPTPCVTLTSRVWAGQGVIRKEASTVAKRSEASL